MCASASSIHARRPRDVPLRSWLATAVIALDRNQLIALVRTGRDDERCVLAAGHVEFHAIELDQRGHVAARLFSSAGQACSRVTREWPGPP